MKTLPPFFFVALGSASLVFSQDEKPVDSLEASTSQTTVSALRKIPNGTSPPPAPVKPGFTVPARDVFKTETHQQGGWTITIQQIKPIALPVPEKPVPPPTPGTLAVLSKNPTAAYQGCEAARLRNEVALTDHPAKPKNIVLNHWRTAAPATQQKGEPTR